MVKLFATLLLVGASLQSFSQCAMIPAPIGERISASKLIVEGRVISQESYLENGRIYTNNKIEPYKVFKPEVSADYIIIRTEGGQVGNMAETTSNLLWLNIGDYGIFTCIPLENKASVYDVYTSAQGFIRFNEDFTSATDIFNTYSDISRQLYHVLEQQTGRKATIIKTLNAHNSGKVSAAPVILSLSPDKIPGGMKSVLTIQGSGFGTDRNSSYVLFPNVDAGGKTFLRPAIAQYVSWSDTEIRVEVPSKAGSGKVKVVVSPVTATSIDSIIIPYSQINIDSLKPARARHVDASSDGGYNWVMNSSFKDSLAARGAFEKQFSKWRCANGVNWHISQSTTAANTSKLDKINIITFEVLPKNVLGVCRSYYSGCSDGTWFVGELDISFTPQVSGIRWHYDENSSINAQYDFSSVVLHELGHGMQLAHSANPNALMYYALKQNQIKASIDADALAGSETILTYDETGNSCGPAPMAIIGSDNCSNPYYVHQFNNSIKSVPNPCTAQTNVEFSLEKSGIISIELYDHKGNYIAQLSKNLLGAGQHDIPVTFDSFYPAGMYFVRVVKDDKVLCTGKVLKQ